MVPVPPPAPAPIAPTPASRPAPARRILPLALLLAGLTACTVPPPNDPAPTTETIGDLFPDRSADPADRRPVPLVIVHHLAMRLDEPSEPIWALIDEQALPPLIRGVWQANGIRAGLMNRAELDRLVEVLPSVQGVRQWQLLPGQRPEPLLVAARQPVPTTIDLTIPPRPVHEAIARGGHLQLLATFTPIEAGPDTPATIAMALTPHHHVPRARLVPVSPLEAALDGRSFDPLTLRVDLPPDRLLVLGLYREPPTEPADPADTAAQSADPTDPDTPAEPADPPNPPEPAATDPLPPLPPHLGRALFTGRHHRQNVQVLVLVGARFPPPPDPVPDP